MRRFAIASIVGWFIFAIASAVPAFAARNVDLRTTCIPHQATVARPVLKMEVLFPDAAKDAKQQGAPQ